MQMVSLVFQQKIKVLEKNKIQIQASGGLSEEEIQKMVKDAEANKEADKKKRILWTQEIRQIVWFSQQKKV